MPDEPHDDAPASPEPGALPLEAPTPDAPDAVSAAEPSPARRAGSAFLSGLSIAGRAIGRGAVATGRAVAAGYRAIDPDLRAQVAQFPVLGLTLLAERQETLVAKPDDGHPLLVCVHGLGGHRGNFSLLRTALEWSGRTRSYALALAEGPELEALAEQLRADVRALLELNAPGDEALQVDLVAHSMGGVVSRIALEDPAFARRVRTLVTLGTPHRGTHMARLADTPRTRALRPDSPLITKLNAQNPWPGPPTMPRLVCFYSRSDMIVPAEASVLEGAECVELEGSTHTGFLLHPRAFARIGRALDGLVP